MNLWCSKANLLKAYDLKNRARLWFYSTLRNFYTNVNLSKACDPRSQTIPITLRNFYLKVNLPKACDLRSRTRPRFCLTLRNFYSKVNLFVLWYAYHVHDKMSLRCFCVSFWILWNKKVAGIILFLWFWNIAWLCVFTFYPNLHTFCIWCTHTHTLWHVWMLNVMILSCLDIICLHMSIYFWITTLNSIFRVLIQNSDLGLTCC